MPASQAQIAEPTMLRLYAASPADTETIGRALAPALSAGDVIALHGPLGAGKSHLARAVIRARLGDHRADVPSPSYTLVNIYEAVGVEIWHADLYRLDPEELGEIGLADRSADSILLVEWAERWPNLPERRLDVVLEYAGAEARRLSVVPHGAGWHRVMRALGGTA